MFIPASTFSDLAIFASPLRLFQPPRLLERWEYVDLPFFSEKVLFKLPFDAEAAEKFLNDIYN